MTRILILLGDLWPCPFCGHSAEHIKLDEPEGSVNWGGEIIACSVCGVATAVVFGIKKSALEHLAELWNRRTPHLHPERNVEVTDD